MSATAAGLDPGRDQSRRVLAPLDDAHCRRRLIHSRCFHQESPPSRSRFLWTDKRFIEDALTGVTHLGNVRQKLDSLRPNKVLRANKSGGNKQEARTTWREFDRKAAERGAGRRPLKFGRTGPSGERTNRPASK